MRAAPRPVWLILLNPKIRRPDNQRELAEAIRVREATLTHHLNALDARGLVTRTRDAANRRIQVVALTEAANSAWRLPPGVTDLVASLLRRRQRRIPAAAGASLA
jgi:MarR family transcriptional regulator for hemolysin